MLIQYPDVAERKQRLSELLGIEDKIWAQVGKGEKIWPIADEDLDRSKDDKTAVHFMDINSPIMIGSHSRLAHQFGLESSIWRTLLTRSR